MSTFSSGTNRVQTIQDVIGLLNQQVQQALTPPSQGAILNTLVQDSESITTTDALTAANTGVPATWGNGTWGFFQWN